MPAVTDYASLIAACADQVTRDDLDWPLFVQSANLRLGRDVVPVLPIVSVTLNATGERVALPEGFVGLVSAKTSAHGPIKLTSPEIRQARGIAYGTGAPIWASIENGDLVLAPVPGGLTPIFLTYRALPVLPSVSVPVTATLTAYPLLYLYGAICEAARKLQDDNLQAQYEALFAREVDAVVRAQMRRAYGGTVVSPQPSIGFDPP